MVVLLWLGLPLVAPPSPLLGALRVIPLEVWRDSGLLFVLAIACTKYMLPWDPIHSTLACHGMLHVEPYVPRIQGAYTVFPWLSLDNCTKRRKGWLSGTYNSADATTISLPQY